jgi:hypothetical protein
MADQPQTALPQNNPPSQENPLDWVKQNIGAKRISVEEATPGFVRTSQPAQGAPVPQPAPAVSVPPPVPQTPAEADAFVQTLMESAAAPAVAPVVSPEDAPVEGEEQGKSPEQSLKDMRKIIRKVNKDLEEERTVRTRTEEQLEKFKTGEAIPEVLKEKETRIAQLETYEKLHALKLSPEYQEKFVQPFQEETQKAAAVAKDYGVDPRIVGEALKIENKRELNNFLRSHFDDTGIMEFRGHLDRARELSAQANAAEREPAESMTRLQSEFQSQQREREERRVASIKGNAQSGWSTALKELSASGEYPELTLTGDPEHDKIVTEVRTNAASEFGKFITLLGNSGVKDLPPDAAKILAKRFQMSQASAIMAKSRAHHYSRSEEVLETSRRTASMIRPQVGGMNDGVPAGGGGAAPARTQGTLQDKGEQLLNSVLQKRR